MKSVTRLSLILVALLSAPALAFGSSADQIDRWRIRAEIRCEVRGALREAQRARWSARLDMLRARSLERQLVRDAYRQAGGTDSVPGV